MNNFNMPAHLTGDMAKLWEALKLTAGTDPASVVKIPAAETEKIGLIRSLAVVGGCEITSDTAEGIEVKLMFAPEETEANAADLEPAVAKPHKFANEE